MPHDVGVRRECLQATDDSATEGFKLHGWHLLNEVVIVDDIPIGLVEEHAPRFYQVSFPQAFGLR